MPTALLRPRYLRAALGAASKVSLLQLERDEGAPLEPLAMGLADAGRRWNRPVDDGDVEVVVRDDRLDVELFGLLPLRRVRDFPQRYAARPDAQPRLSLGISP